MVKFRLHSLKLHHGAYELLQLMGSFRDCKLFGNCFNVEELDVRRIKEVRNEGKTLRIHNFRNYV